MAQPAVGEKKVEAGTWEWGPKEIPLFWGSDYPLPTEPKLRAEINTTQNHICLRFSHLTQHYWKALLSSWHYCPGSILHQLL